MFSFASKMLNSIMAADQPPGPGQPGQSLGIGQSMSQQQHHVPQQQHLQQQQPVRPMTGFPQVRPSPQMSGVGGTGPRPFTTFSGPRPNPNLVRAPNFGTPPRPMGGPGTPHRFNGPQPAPGMPPRGMHPGVPQQQQGMRPGPPPGVTMRPRGPGLGQGSFQQNIPRLPMAEVEPVDLSHLSAEERAMIENVMAKAQQLEQEVPPAPVLGISQNTLPGQLGPQRMMRPEDQQLSGDYGTGRPCPLCRQRDVSGRDGQECSECRTVVCNRCGGVATHPESKRPEWTCGNCIKRRRMTGAAGSQSLGPRPPGPYSQQQTNPNMMEWGSSGPPGGPSQQQQQQQQQQQRWENEREFTESVDDGLSVDEGKEGVGVGTSWGSEVSGGQRGYSEEMTFPSSSHGERTEQSEENFLSPPSSKSPVVLDDEPHPFLTTTLSPDHSLSMSTPVSASASKAKPSFVKMHSRSISLENDMSEGGGVGGEGQGGGTSSSTSITYTPPLPLNNGYGMSSMHSPQNLSSCEFTPSSYPPPSMSSSSYNNNISSSSSSSAGVTAVGSTQSDSKTNALMEELSKLQSAVESYSQKRLERQRMGGEDGESSGRGVGGGRTRGDGHLSKLSLSPLSRSKSPTPSPSPKESPGKSGESLSPLHSMSPVYHSGMDSPESPESEFPPPRKAIVMKEHDLDDYKSSTDEDTDSDSDGLGGSEVVAYYDHSPGEVYTIPEEEDEGGSPTGADLVTSLNRPGIHNQGVMGENGSPRRRMMGQECVPPGMMPIDQRHSIRPQLRPQRSLDNRVNPSVMTSQQQQQQQQQQQSMDMLGQPTMDQQGNISYSTNNMNTQGALNQGLIGGVDNQSQLHSLNQSTINSLTSTTGPNSLMTQAGILGTTSAPISATTSTGVLINQQQQLQQPQTQSMYGQPPCSEQSVVDLNIMQQRSLQQQQQNQQIQPGGVGVVGTSGEWSNIHSSSSLGPTSGIISVTSTDTSLPVVSHNQPYQQQPPSQPQPSNILNAPQQILPTTQMQPQQQQQLQQQLLQQQQILQQSTQQQIPLQLNQQLQPIDPLNPMANVPQQLQPQGPLQPQQQQQQLYDQSGRPISSSSTIAPYSQMQQPTQQQYQQQQQQHPTQQGPQSQFQHGMGQQHGQTGHLNVTSQAGPGAKSISGLLADFSRALGLGSTSPRPSPSEDKSEPFPIPGGMTGQIPLSSYHHPQHAHQQQAALQQQQQSSLYQQQQQPGVQQHIQQSAFAPIQDSNQQAFLQRQQQQHQVGQPGYQTTLQQQQAQQSLANQMNLQNLHYGTSIHPQQSAQQYSHSGSLHHPQPSSAVMTQGGNVMTQQQAASLGVVGALSPAQAQMYQQQQQAALNFYPGQAHSSAEQRQQQFEFQQRQHQQQHMKKTSRRAHTHLSSSTTGEIRRDGSTLLIGGQGLTVGSLTPAVVTSLGTFIGSGQTLIGTSLLSQPLAVTPLTTPILGTPCGTPRSGRGDPCGGDSSDTMSETDSQKSLRMRRKLPCLPPDQEAAPLPSTKKRDRQRAQETFRSLSPMRLSSLDQTVSGNRHYGMSGLSLSRPSASESNLRKLCMGASDPIPRPGSALGLLQASSVVSSMGAKSDTVYPLSGNLFSTSATFPGMGLRTTTSGFTASSDLTTTTSVLSGLYPSYKTTDNWSSNMAELAACLPPDLRHLLNKGDQHDINSGMMSMSGLTGLTSSSLGDTSLNVGSHLPSYMRTLREQLQEERRQLLSEERRRLEALRERDRELGARLDAVTSRAGSDSVRSRADLSTRNVGISRSAGASPLLSRKIKGHRRQLSADPKLSLPFSPIQEDGDTELLQDYTRSSAGILRPPYKSYEYESLEDTTLMRPTSGLGDWDHSQSYLASSWAAAGGILRETAINSMGGSLMMSEEEDARSRVTSRFLSRRSSEGEAWPQVTRSPSSSRDKRHQVRKHRKSRSWHPSPYVSEEEDEEEEDNLSREEKKARIKAEIARRRQQIQEKAGLHHELLRISRLREGAEHERHSVLKSVDQLLRDQYGRYDSSSIGGVGSSSSSAYLGRGGVGGGGGGGIYTHHSHNNSLSSSSQRGIVHRGPGGLIVSPSASEEDRSIERIASTFRSDDYTSMLYERLGEMSPLATDSESMASEYMGNTPAAMPLLPDMPTRSRRLLEDLGSVPIGMAEGGRSSNLGGNMKGRLPQVGVQSPPPLPPSRASLLDSPGLRGIKSPGGDSSLRYPSSSDDYGTIGEGDGDGDDGEGCPSSLSMSIGGGGGRSKSNKVTDSNNGSPEPSPCVVQANRSQASNPHPQSSSGSKSKYNFPIKRLLLNSRDPKDKKCVGGTRVVGGMRIVGGKEIPGSNGRIAAYVAKIYGDGGLADTMDDVNEGDVVLEWNGVSLDDKTFEDVQSIVGSSSDGEVEVVLRSDFDILTGKSRSSTNRLGGHQSCRRRPPPQGSVSGSSRALCHSQLSPAIENDKSASYNMGSTWPSHMENEMGKGHGYGLGNLAKSPSTSTDVTTTSVAMLTDDQSLRTGGFGSGSDSQRHSISLAPTDTTTETSIILPASTHPLNEPLSSSHSQNNLSSYPINNTSKARSKSNKNVKKSSSNNGQIQLLVCHDPKANILYVTVLKAKLPKQHNDDGTDPVQINPYIVVYLIPEKVLENQRRTRHVPMCTSPQWNQTMVYPGVSTLDLKTKLLEVSAWNYNPTGDDEFLGKVIFELAEEGILDEQPHSYILRKDEGSARRRSGARLSKSLGKGKRFSDTGKGADLGGRMSIFAPPTQGTMPTDCRAAFCILL